MEQNTAIQYVPITINFHGVILWGLFAPLGYSELSRSYKATAYLPHGNKLPANEAKPVNLRLNGENLQPGIMATQNFFSDLKYLKAAGKITHIRQTDGRLMIAEKHHPLIL